jgi:hypothetical protein
MDANPRFRIWGQPRQIGKYSSHAYQPWEMSFKYTNLFRAYSGQTHSDLHVVLESLLCDSADATEECFLAFTLLDGELVSHFFVLHAWPLLRFQAGA